MVEGRPSAGAKAHVNVKPYAALKRRSTTSLNTEWRDVERRCLNLNAEVA